MRNDRPPTPLSLRKLRGNPSGKSLDPPEQVPPRGPLGEPPDWFDDDQRAVWKDLQAAAPYGLLTLADMPLVVAYVVAVALHRRAVIAMRDGGGPVITTKDGNLVQSPWLPIQNRQALIALKCASEMGLTPVSRAVLAARMREAGGVFPSARGESALEKYLREKPDKLDPN
jgi:P27 family predicted phage terminase small subunit